MSRSTLARIADKSGIGLGDLLDPQRDLPEPGHGSEEAELLRACAGRSKGRRQLLLRLARELSESR